MTVGANWNEVPDGIHTHSATHKCQRGDVMNFDVIFTNFAIQPTKLEAADLACSAVSKDAGRAVGCASLVLAHKHLRARTFIHSGHALVIDLTGD